MLTSPAVLFLVSVQTAFHLPHRCTDLNTLNLAGLQGVTHSGVAYISFLPALEHLCLARCNVRSQLAPRT